MAEATIRAVIWDVDGTLVDTAELHFQAWDRLARERRLPFTREGFTATFGWRNPEVIRKLFGTHYTDREIDELAMRKEALYRAAAAEGVGLLPGVRSLLEGLAAAGWRQAIGSSAPRENVDLILRLTNTERFFQAVITMEDTQRGKPDPQVFELAAARLGASLARCVVLEDAVAGVQAAKAGGMKCIAVTCVGHHPVTSLKHAGADLIVPSLEEVSAQIVLELIGADEA